MFNDLVFIIPAAVLLDWLLGDPRWLPHPVVFIGKLIAFLEKVLRRMIRNELLGGGILLLLTVGITVTLAALLLKLAYAINPAAGFAASLLLSWSCLAARSLQLESALVAKALENGDVAGARKYLSFIVGRDTAQLTAEEIWRGAVETVAENTADGVIAPLFFLMLGGPLLGLAYKAVNTLDSMVGYKNEKYLLFGRAAARFDDLANWLPARLTGLLLVLSAPVSGLAMKNAWRMMRRDGGNHSSPNSGIPEAAAAGALGVQLGGTNRYFGIPVPKPTIGEPLHPLDCRDWQGAVRLMFAAETLMLLLWGIVMLNL